MGSRTRFRCAGKSDASSDKDLPKELERVIVQRYAPACVAVKENGEALYFLGQISRYLVTPAGSPENNVIHMAREGLRLPLLTSLHRAVTSHERIVQKQLSVQEDGRTSHVDPTVEPLADSDYANLYMIVVEEVLPDSKRSAPPTEIGAEETIR